MTERGRAPFADPYSPQRRTALILTGTGTAGAYHAGVLRALHEAGVKLDIVAGRGIGSIGALFAAVDGAQRLWDEKGFWRVAAVRRLYQWRPVLRLTVAALFVAVALVAVPLVVMAAGLVVFPIDFVLKMVGVSAASGLVPRYLDLAETAFAPTALPTWLPRLVLIVFGLAGITAAAAGWIERSRRRHRGSVWWRFVRAPLSTATAVNHCWAVMWDLVRGAAVLEQPTPDDLGRRYGELLADNLGQPGFRELLIAVHDVDAHRDLIFALVGEARRRDLLRRPTSAEADTRRAEVLDLSGVARGHLTDAIAGFACGAAGDRAAHDPICARRLLARRSPSPLRSARQPPPPGRRARDPRGRADRPGVCRARRRRARTRWRRLGSTAAAASANTCSRRRRRASATWRGARSRAGRAFSRFSPRTIRSARSISQAASTIDPIACSRSPSS